MKSAFSGTFLFQIVIFFVILFTGYICLSINQSKAFNVKNSIVKVFERYGPNLNGIADLSSSFSNDIENTLERSGYRLSGTCDDSNGWIGFDRTGEIATIGNVAFCARQIYVDIPGTSATDGYYYQIITFYHLEIPIFRSLFNLEAKGESKIIYRNPAINY